MLRRKYHRFYVKDEGGIYNQVIVKLYKQKTEKVLGGGEQYYHIYLDFKKYTESTAICRAIEIADEFHKFNYCNYWEVIVDRTKCRIEKITKRYLRNIQKTETFINYTRFSSSILDKIFLHCDIYTEKEALKKVSHLIKKEKIDAEKNKENEVKRTEYLNQFLKGDNDDFL